MCVWCVCVVCGVCGVVCISFSALVTNICFLLCKEVTTAAMWLVLALNSVPGVL